MEYYWVLADRVEVNIYSDLSHLASDNLRKRTTVPSQCKIFPWTLMWHLLYFDHLYHLKSVLVLFNLLRVSDYHYNKGHLRLEFFKYNTIHSRLLCISFLQSILLWWKIKFVFIYIIVRYTDRGTFNSIFH